MGGIAENIKVQLKGVKSVQPENVEVEDKMDQSDIMYHMRRFAPSLGSHTEPQGH